MRVIKFLKFLPVPIVVAVLAFIWMYVSAQLKLLAWVAFITWAGYFLAGMDVRGALRLGISFFLGVLFAMLIVFLGTSLVPSLGIYAFPVVVAIAAFLIVLLEMVPWFDLAPGYFLGAAAFFAAGATNNLTTFLAVIMPALLGIGLGMITGFLRGSIFKLEHVKDPLKEEKK